MKRGILHARIPTLFAIVLLLTGVFSSILLVQRQITTSGRASQEAVPENIQITNITDSSFTVTFVTNLSTTASIALVSGEGNTVLIDDRDKAVGEQRTRNTHSITAIGLSPNTEYSFFIITGSKQYDNSGQAFTVRTGSVIQHAPPNQIPLFGKISLPGNTPATEAMVFVSTQNSQLLSTTTNENGEFLLPLNSLRTKSVDSYEILQDTTILDLVAVSGSISSEIDVLYKNAEEIPPIILSQNYAFTSDFAPREIPTQSLQTFSSYDSSQNFEVFIPSEGESFIDLQPEFIGTAQINSRVQLEISGNTDTSGAVNADTEGLWSFRPDDELLPGQYVLTVSGVGKNGSNQSVSRNFVVFTEGSQIAQVSEPTRSPNQPTPTLTTVSTPTPAASPTQALSPTPTIADQPTATPTLDPTPTILPSPTEALQTTTPIPPTEVPPTKTPEVGFAFSGALTIAVGIVILTGISLFILF